MDTIRDYVRTALNGVRQRFNKLEKDLDKKLDDKLGRDELPPPQPQIQSDWNESNEESVAYVCNRPFYDDIVVKTYTYENVGQSGQTSLIIDADFEGNFILGETYTVTVNGTATDIVATTNQVGDPALFYNSSTYNRIFVSSGRLCAFTWWNSGSTVSITGPIHVLKQIDSKFLNVVSSLNGETGDVVINADKLGAASSQSWTYMLDERQNDAYSSHTTVGRDWLGLGSDELTGLVLGNIIAYDDIENDLPVARFTFIPDLKKQSHSDNEDVVIRGVANPTALNDATSKSYVDKAINNIGKGFASVEYVDKKLNDAIPVPATATVGQTIAVKSVDENGKPTAWEPMDFISENYGGNAVQPDWNQNDPTAPDYVKNRPFWESEEKQVTVLEYYEIAFSEGWGTFDFPLDILPEDECIITIDGKTVTGIAEEYDGCVYVDAEDISLDVYSDYAEIGYNEVSGVYTLTITVNRREIKRIDRKFIPFNMQAINEDGIKKPIDKLTLFVYDGTEEYPPFKDIYLKQHNDKSISIGYSEKIYNIPYIYVLDPKTSFKTSNTSGVKITQYEKSGIIDSEIQSVFYDERTLVRIELVGATSLLTIKKEYNDSTIYYGYTYDHSSREYKCKVTFTLTNGSADEGEPYTVTIETESMEVW